MTTKSRLEFLLGFLGVFVPLTAWAAGNTDRTSLNVKNVNGSGTTIYNTSGTVTLPNVTGTALVSGGTISITDLTMTGNLVSSGGTSEFDKAVGIGGAASTAGGMLNVTAPTSYLTGTTQYGIDTFNTFNSAATTAAYNFYSGAQIQNQSFTLPIYAGFYAADITKGASATLTNQYGLYVAPQTKGATNYAIYTGNTQSRFDGKLGVKMDPTNDLDVTGTFGVTGNATLGGSSNSVGTITSGTWSGTAILPAKGGTGLSTITAHGVMIGEGTSNVAPLAAAAAGTLLAGQGTSADPAFSATPTLGVAGTTLGSLSLAGNTSGAITVTPQAAAGTYNFNLPITAGNLGQVLTSGGGGSTAMTWSSALVNNMTTLGDILYGGAAGASTRLAGDTTNSKVFLREQSAAGTAAAPSWNTIASTDLSDTANISLLNAANTFTTNTNTYSLSAGSSTYVMKFSGPVYTAGTTTTSFPMLGLIDAGPSGSAAWNASGTYIGINAPTGFAGDLVRFNLNNTSKFKVDNTGLITTAVAIGAVSGGTGVSSPTAHAVMLGEGSSAMTALALDASTTKVLTSGGASADPTWAAISATNITTGALPVAQGGTGNDGAAWTTAAPTCASAGGTITTVGTTAARYKVYGKTTVWTGVCNITTNGTGSGSIHITLPFTAATSTPMWICHGRENGVSGKMLQGVISSAGTFVDIYNYDNTYPGANSAQIEITCTYEQT